MGRKRKYTKKTKQKTKQKRGKGIPYIYNNKIYQQKNLKKVLVQFQHSYQDYQKTQMTLLIFNQQKKIYNKRQKKKI